VLRRERHFVAPHIFDALVDEGDVQKVEGVLVLRDVPGQQTQNRSSGVS